MKKWKWITEGIQYFFYTYLLVLTLGIVGFFIIPWIETNLENFGLLTGVILSVGLAFTVTMLILRVSNDAGRDEGKFKDFTEKPMEFLD